jgi:hypothetical protein
MFLLIFPASLHTWVAKLVDTQVGSLAFVGFLDRDDHA